MKRIFTLALGALAMLAVALISAFIAMRLAIHGREAAVPPLTGLTLTDATRAAGHVGLRVDLENRFYSSVVEAGRVLAQDPPPGSRVRREWPIRITESLGPQRVNVPDLVGESEREATISIRRLSLETGTVAHLPLPGDSDVVIAQTPTPNAGGADSPLVSFLVSDPDQSERPAYIMPSLLGLRLSAASAHTAAAGLHIVLAAENPPPPASVGVATGSASAPPNPPSPTEPVTSGVVIAQTPAPGSRVEQGGTVHVALGHPENSGQLNSPQ